MIEYPVVPTAVFVERSSTTDDPGPKGDSMSLSAGPTCSIHASHSAISAATSSGAIAEISIASPRKKSIMYFGIRTSRSV
jgi:hypothetical protein